MDVSAIVLLYGGTEDQAIGALLHDAAEDAGGRARLEDIRQNFGDAVAEIVEGCTDTFDAWRAGRLQALLGKAGVKFDADAVQDPGSFLPAWIQGKPGARG